MSVDVFRKLRIKLALSIAVVLAIVLAVLIGSFNVYLGSSNSHDADAFIDELVQNDGKRSRPGNMPLDDMHKPPEKFDDKNMNGNKMILPPPDHNGIGGDERPPDMPPELKNNKESNEGLLSVLGLVRNRFSGFRDFYTAKLDASGNVTQMVNDFSQQIGNEQKTNLVRTIFNLKRDKGTYQLYGYEVAKKEYGYLIVILDRAMELTQQKRFMIASLVLYILNLFLSFGVSWAFALWSLKPVQEAFIKQKQFIADASHELKTPIAVIGANIDVLQQEIPHNKWLDYIKEENSRMSGLVKDLLYLAKNDAGRDSLMKLPFDLGDATACAVLPFESIAFEQHKNLDIEIPKIPIPVVADENKIKQIIIILTDNALKNSDSGATIKISAGIEGSRRFVKVYNTGTGIAPQDLDKLFNRFYRADSSRNRNTGGYGLGLAIAQTIAVAHGGKITVASTYGKFAEFTLRLPSGGKEKKRFFSRTE